MSDRSRGAAFGIAGAILFGASAPLAKLLLASVTPVLLAALFYLGAGASLSLYRAWARSPITIRHAPFSRGDWWLLAAVTVSGGIAGPLLLYFGLGRVSGVAGALLLNLEAVFTILFALLFFREHLPVSEACAAGVIVVGAALLGYRPGAAGVDWLGILAIAGACLSWGLDNNLTQRLSLRDPTSVAQVKTLGAGTCTLAIAFATGQPLPGPGILAAALIIGALSYGLSIVFDVYALRYLGAAREAAFFAMAPFAGAALTVPLLKELPTAIDYAAAALMATGVIILLRARHSHWHRHQELVHEHEHVHDEHHQHEHQGVKSEPHSHPHRHLTLEHEHPHVSDLHHRHQHKH